MGAIFTRLHDNTTQPTPVKNIYEVEMSAYHYVINEHLEMDPEFTSIVIESMRGMYFGLKEDIPELVTEATLDFSVNLSKWFKSWISNINDFEKKSLKQLAAEYLALMKKVAKYENTPVEKLVENFGYKDFNIYNDINPYYFTELISKITIGIQDIEKAGKGNVATTIARVLNEINDPQLMNSFRGKIIKGNPIEEANFRNTLKEFYMGPKVRFDLNTANMYALAKKLNSMEGTLDGLSKDFATIKNLSKQCIEALTKFSSSFKSYQEKLEKDMNMDLEEKSVLSMKVRGKIMYVSKAIVALKKLIMAYQVCMAVKLDTIHVMFKTYNQYFDKAYGGVK